MADESYLDVGRMIAGLCPQGFREAVLDVRLGDGAPEFDLRCTLYDGSAAAPPLYPLARDTLAARLRDLRAEEGRDWKSCTITLRRGGGFEMEVGD